MDQEVKVWNKVAKDYFGEIISPFSEGVQNPIFWYLEKKLGVNPSQMSVIDIGCGIGNFLLPLSEKFSQVVGLDFSPKMIEAAKEKVKEKSNVTLYVRDARDLKEFNGQFDVAVAVNSVLLPKIADDEKIMKEIHGVLKEGGFLLGVFPSMESHLFKALLVQEKALEEGKSEEEAIKLSQEEAKDCDLVTALVRYPDSTQKNYYLFELKHRLKRAGFSKIKIRKVYYPWEIYEDDTLLSFKKKGKMWDWFVFAVK